MGKKLKPIFKSLTPLIQMPSIGFFLATALRVITCSNSDYYYQKRELCHLQLCSGQLCDQMRQIPLCYGKREIFWLWKVFGNELYLQRLKVAPGRCKRIQVCVLLPCINSHIFVGRLWTYTWNNEIIALNILISPVIRFLLKTMSSVWVGYITTWRTLVCHRAFDIQHSTVTLALSWSKT